MENNTHIGHAIRKMRKLRKLTQAEVSKSAGISVNSLRLYEAGKITPKTDIVEKIAAALTVPASLLFRWNEEIDIDTDEDFIKFKLMSNELILKEIDEHYAEQDKRYKEVVLQKHIELYNQLNEAGKHFADEFIELLLQRPTYNDNLE